MPDTLSNQRLITCLSNMTGSSEYCSPHCGKTVKGVDCDDECETRGSNYYWCNIGSTWDYCSRTSCSIRIPDSYEDCTTEIKNKTLWFEYLYYPGYWLAKGYDNRLAAIWEPTNGIDGKELFCPDEGYGWYVHEGHDGNIFLESTRPGYENYFLKGFYGGEGKNQPKINTGKATNIEDNKQYHEAYAFRIICQNCSTMKKCILWRLHDESKLYTKTNGYLRMCRECGSKSWFDWRVLAPDHANFTCSSAFNICCHLSPMRQVLVIFSMIALNKFYAT